MFEFVAIVSVKCLRNQSIGWNIEKFDREREEI